MKKSLLMILTIAVVVVCVCTLFACGNKYDYKIGVQNGTTGQKYVEGDVEWEFDGFSNIDCRGYNNGGLAVQDMLAGQVDFVIIDEMPARALVNRISGIKIIEVPLTVEEYAFGVDKAQDNLRIAANEVLAELKADGTFDAICRKYFDGEGTIEGITSASKDLNKAAQQLVVATNAAFAPFEYKIGDKFAGVDMEIAKAIADKLGLELVIEDMDFEAVVTSVGVNGVDIAMAGLTKSPAREESVNFSDSYYNASQVIIVKANDTTFDNCTTVEEIEAILRKQA